MVEYIVHGFVVIMVLADLRSHWTHHKRSKQQRADQQLYTLQDAFEIIKRGAQEQRVKV